jgi:hypothetical protein
MERTSIVQYGRQFLFLTLLAVATTLPHPVSAASVTPWTKNQLVAALVAAQKAPLKIQTTTPALTALVTPIDISAASGNGLISPQCQPFGHPAIARNPVPCLFGETASPKGDVVLYGNSHVDNWIAPLSSAMKAKGYRLNVFAFAGCPATSIDYSKGPFALRSGNVNDCLAWNASLPAKIRAIQPKAIFYTGGPEFSSLLGAQDQAFATGVKGLMTQMGSAPKFILGTTPSLNAAAPACLAQHKSDATFCQMTYRATSFYPKLMQRDQVVAGTTKATLIPTNAMYCQPNAQDRLQWICPAIVDGIVVYTDTNHTTQEYSKRLATVLANALAPLVK